MSWSIIESAVVRIVLEPVRCVVCGMPYAVEKIRASRCPYCAMDDYRHATNLRRKAESVAASLRGVITRMKRGTKAKP